MQASQLERLLIIRMSSIGDIVLTFPLIALLNQHLPGVAIDFVVRTEYAELLQAAPGIRQVIRYDRQSGWRGLREIRHQIKQERYSLILDLHHNWRSIFLRSALWGVPVKRVHKQVINRWLLVHFKWNRYRFPRQVAEKYLQTIAHLGIPLTIPENYFYLPKSITHRMAPVTRELLLENFRVVIAPGARHATKQWPVAYYQQLIKAIHQQYGWRTVLLGSADEAPLLNRIARAHPTLTRSYAGQFTLLESAAMIEALPYFISNDSGLMHIAAALHKPQLAFFGPTVREFGFFPLNDRAIVLEQQGLACRPCSHLGGPRCPKGHFRCMQDTTPEMAFQAFRQLVKPQETHQ